MDLAELLMARFDELNQLSEEPGRLTRRYGTPALRAAQDLVAAWMTEAGLETRRDAAGNLIGRRACGVSGAKTLLLGSHLDSVRDGGKYDGPLGVLCAIAAMERLRDEQLTADVEVYAFADEEGLRFHTAYLGSKAVIGRIDAATLAVRDETGVSVAEAMRVFGGDPETLASAEREAGSLLGYLEIHIEQGPILEQLGLPLGVVTNIIGSGKETFTFIGSAGHAGTVPMAMRRDALTAAAELVLEIERLGRETPGLVATVGKFAVEPGASNVIPGRAHLSLDIRHADDAVWRAVVEHLNARARAIAANRGIDVEIEPVMGTSGVASGPDGVICDPGLTGLLEHAIEAVGQKPLRMVSGAGHDGVPLSSRMPVAMLFVRCKDGISHNPAESILGTDAALAAEVLAAAVRSRTRSTA